MEVRAMCLVNKIYVQGNITEIMMRCAYNEGKMWYNCCARSTSFRIQVHPTKSHKSHRKFYHRFLVFGVKLSRLISRICRLLHKLTNSALFDAATDEFCLLHLGRDFPKLSKCTKNPRDFLFCVSMKFMFSPLDRLHWIWMKAQEQRRQKLIQHFRHGLSTHSTFLCLETFKFWVLNTWSSWAVLKSDSSKIVIKTSSDFQEYPNLHHTRKGKHLFFIYISMRHP